MTEAIEERTTKIDQWRERLAEHERSGFDSEAVLRGAGDHAVFVLRLAKTPAGTRARAFRVGGERTGAARTGVAPGLQLILASGARLRIGAGVDSGTLRTVLEALGA